MKNLTVTCFHGSPGLPEDFMALEKALPENRWVRAARPGYPLSQGVVLKERSVVVGYSWGCVAALREAAQNPELVAGVVLLAPYLWPTSKAGLAKKALIQAPFVGRVLLKKAAPNVIKELLHKSCAPAAVPKEYEALSAKLADPQILLRAVLEKEEKGMSPEDALKRLQAADIPVYVLWGDKDHTTQEETQIDPIKKIVDAEVIKFTGAGHALQWTHTKELSDSLKKIFNEIRAKELS